MDYVGDISHTSSGAAAFFRRYQETKTAKNVEETMAFFSNDRLTYSDATLGWVLDRESLGGVFSTNMPTWAAGRSYATSVLGTESSAVVFVRDTAELFGSDLLIIGAVDIEDGAITRWTDYWDGRNDASATIQQRTPQADFPQTYGEATTPQHAQGAVLGAAQGLSDALASGDTTAATAFFSEDASLEDMTLRTRIRGRLAIGRYLERAGGSLPYGHGATVRRIHGGDLGGGYEWIHENHAVPRGICALALDPDGQICAATAVWDGTLVRDDEYVALVDLSRER